MAIIHRIVVPCSSLRRRWVHAPAQHKLLAALLLSVLGWSVTWAQALALISVVPTWFAISLFYAGLGLIPFCRSPSTDN